MLNQKAGAWRLPPMGKILTLLPARRRYVKYHGATAVPSASARVTARPGALQAAKGQQPASTAAYRFGYKINKNKYL